MKRKHLLPLALCMLLVSLAGLNASSAQAQIAGEDRLYIDVVVFSDTKLLLPIPVLTRGDISQLYVKGLFDGEGRAMSFSQPRPFDSEETVKTDTGWYEHITWLSFEGLSESFSVSRISLQVGDQQYEYLPEKFSVRVFRPRANDQKIVPISYGFNTPLDAAMETQYKMSAYLDMTVTGVHFTSSQTISSVSLGDQTVAQGEVRFPVAKDEVLNLTIRHAPQEGLSGYTYISACVQYTLEEGGEVYESWLPQLDLMVRSAQRRAADIEKYISENMN